MGLWPIFCFRDLLRLQDNRIATPHRERRRTAPAADPGDRRPRFRVSRYRVRAQPRQQPVAHLHRCAGSSHHAGRLRGGEPRGVGDARRERPHRWSLHAGNLLARTGSPAVHAGAIQPVSGPTGQAGAEPPGPGAQAAAGCHSVRRGRQHRHRARWRGLRRGTREHPEGASGPRPGGAGSVAGSKEQGREEGAEQASQVLEFGRRKAPVER